MPEAPDNPRRQGLPEAAGVLRTCRGVDVVTTRVAPIGVFHVPEPALLSFLSDLADQRVRSTRGGRPLRIEALGVFDGQDGEPVAAFRGFPGGPATGEAVEAPPLTGQRDAVEKRVEWVVENLPAPGVAVKLRQLVPRGDCKIFRRMVAALERDERVVVTLRSNPRGRPSQWVERRA